MTHREPRRVGASGGEEDERGRTGALGTWREKETCTTHCLVIYFLMIFV
jgi:hypothetical protein